MALGRRLTACLLLAMTLGLAPEASAVDVSGDDANDRFVGSGETGSSSAGSGSSGGSSTHTSTHACVHCAWMASDPCSADSIAHGCGALSQGCPQGQQLRRMWFTDDDGLIWQDRGLRCLGPAETSSQLPSAQAVRETFARAVPAAHISSEPSVGVLPQVPTLFSSGQPSTLAPSRHHIGDHLVELSPSAHWQWDFGDGGALETTLAGSHYPDRAVSHVYRRAGEFRVRLKTTWTATYTVDGQGPFAVDGPVTQVSRARIRVGQGRSVLS